MNSKKIKRPFIDFYNKYDIIPTSNKSNLNRQIFSRNFLYTNLGVPLKFFKDKRIIEFGPGGGWNAISTSFYKPREYCFVDASKKSIKEIKKKIKNKKIKALKTSIINKDILNLKTSKKFEIAIAEGIVPNQKYPKKMLKIISSHLEKNGILIISLQTGISLLSEFCRRILIIKTFNDYNSFNDQLRNAVDIYKLHLKTLKFSTRPINDWVLDVVFNEQTEKNKVIFGSDDAIRFLNKNMDIYNSFPKFFYDGRWYKSVITSNNSNNKLFLDQYYKFSINFIDYREKFERQSLSKNKAQEIEKICSKVCILQNKMIKQRSYKEIDEFIKLLITISSKLPNNFKNTKECIHEFTVDIKKYIKGTKPKNLFRKFRYWWGRGAQYTSYIKK
tara:strand:- start:14250 stop:15413 length:1164 start_codon:yes stop_codon:yes gene_type:complete